MVKTASKTSQGLARAKEVYENRFERIREVKEEGKKVFGYFCIYPVLEMLTAADIVPFRIFGNMREPVTESDKYVNPLICAFVRSCLDIGVKGEYNFLDGTAWAHTCDMATRLNTIWKTVIRTPNPLFLDVPHQTHKPAVEQYKTLLKEFQEDIEMISGKKLTAARLRKAIALHNQQRALVRDLYDLRKPDPPLISGVETLQVIKSVMSLPIEEGNQLLKEVIDEVKKRKTGGPKKKSARILIWGPVIDDTGFIEMIESLDANVVMDDMCVGTRAYYPDVPVTDDPLDGLTYHYLVELKCPRTLKEGILGEFRHDYQTSLSVKFGYLKDYVQGWKVNGGVLQAMVFCDIHAFEVPVVKDYLQQFGVSSIYLEQDYSEASLAQFRTRVQGLVEVIGTK